MKRSLLFFIIIFITTTIKATSDPFDEALSDLKVNGHSMRFITDQNCFLITTPLSDFGNRMTARIRYKAKEGWGPLKINGWTVADSSNYTFSKIDNNRDCIISISNEDGTTIRRLVKFTSLNIIFLDGTFDKTYKEGTITIQEPGSDQEQILHINCKWRGNISNTAGKHKHNFHVKLIQAGGAKLNRSLLGLRSDNSWILDAGQADMIRIRNRILTDLWNDYSAKPYYADIEKDARTGTRGQFAELILNGEYQGIYSMNEALDRKQMKLRKYDDDTSSQHGQLWKSKAWSYAVFMGHDLNDDNYPMSAPADVDTLSDSWENYFLKYPDITETNTADWQLLYDAVKFVCTASDADFKRHAAEYFDLPVVIDYYILMETVLATDNHGKNLFFAVHDKERDQRITLGVWDLDATLGQRWSPLYHHADILQPEQDYTDYISTNEHGDYNLFRRLRQTDAQDFNMQARMRYRDLREGPLATEAILNRFRQQLDEFRICGAGKRESKKWSGDSDIEGHTLNLDTELTYIEDWLTRRMTYLDSVRFNIASLPTSGIAGIEGAPRVRQGIFNLNGQLVSQDCDEQILHALPKGIYIVNGEKMIVGK